MIACDFTILSFIWDVHESGEVSKNKHGTTEEIYPVVRDIDFQYIKDLEVPGGHQDYDDIFNRAAENVANVWATVARGVLESEDACFARIGNWNLYTGRDDQNRLVFWS